MASNKTHLSQLKGNTERDTLSEASESGTSNSVTSAEDLQKLAVILGLNSAEDVYQERFRVDRRRLEAMLAENLEESQTAQVFFHRVMTETNTLINWPARLKIGARSKKDPHVRVAGRPDDVKLAREKIMQLLDTRNNRVTMKIDVSYTDHSHIIGKGGLTIKRVMEETGCHIHFPDSNRTSIVEKSNQVSIAGDMQRVERARARVRALTPLVFTFELPIVSQPLPDLSSPYVQQIQDQYKVQVMLRNRPKLHANLMVVKGVQWEVRATMRATSLLMQYMCGPLASQTQVQMSLEISPMHHSVVVGRGADQLKAIMQGTNTQIMFPDAEDPNIPAIRKSCVTITGQIEDVYAARQQLIGSLPVVVIFDVPEEACRLEGEAAAELMQKYNVYVNIRRKPKQGIASVVIKGIERCIGDVYEARRELVRAEGAVTAEVPESYNIPLPAAAAFNPFSPSHAAAAASPRAPYLDLPHYPVPGALYHTPPTPGGFPSPMSPASLTPPVWLVPSPQPRAAQFSFPASLAVPNHNSPLYQNQGGSWNPLGGTELGSPQMMQYQPLPQDGRLTTLQQILNSSSAASSGYQSNFTGSSVSLDVQNTSGGENGSSVASPSVSPISKTHGHSPAHSSDTDRSHHEIASIVQEVPLSARRAPGCEKKTLETLKMSPAGDYRRLQAEAGQVMRAGAGAGARVPTPRWAGYYFSRTAPGHLALDSDAEPAAATTATAGEPDTPEAGWSRAPAPAHAAPSCRAHQLYDLLQHRALHKYIELFKQHEVDLCTFASLNEADLVELGVTAFGARRKMLLIIAELQKQAQALKECASPGAGRTLPNSPPYDAAALAHDAW